MTDCKDREAQISALVDGTLSGDEQDELMRHIAECERCSEVLAACAALIILSCSLIPDLDPDFGSVNESADSANLAEESDKQENGTCLVGNESGEKQLSSADTERLRSLLAPADERADDYESLPDNAIRISIFGENDELICTVTVVGDKVYADFGDGYYLTACSTEELEIVLND